MSTTQKPEALRLAELLENFLSFPEDIAAAAELRRQHARIAELEAALLQPRPEVVGVTLDGCLETLFRVGEYLGIDYVAARKAPSAPSDVYIKAIEDRAAIKAAWNAQADDGNRWHSLSEGEKVEWAVIHAAAKERAARQAAQVEVVELKERIARAGVEQRRAAAIRAQP